MGVFRKQNQDTPLTRLSIVLGLLITACHFLHGVAEDDSISEDQLYLIWSSIFASGIRCLKAEQDIEFINATLRNQVLNSKFRRVFEKSTTSMEPVLFAPFNENYVKSANEVSQSLAKEVANPTFQNFENADKQVIVELAKPLYQHYLSQMFDELTENIQLLGATLAGSFSIALEDICRGIRTYGVDRSLERIQVAETVFTLPIFLYSLRELNS